MQVTLTIPDAAAARVLASYCAATGWTEESGRTRRQHLEWSLREHIRARVRAWEVSVAGDAAREQARTEVDELDLGGS